MSIWKNSRMDGVYYDETEALEDEPCEVRIDGDLIVVSYEGDDGPILYKGQMKGPGHFVLSAPEVDGKATLHMFEGGKILEGYWLEGGFQGFWRITLSN